MPSTTPVYKLPYPLGTDPIADGDDAIKNLAERLELLMGPWTAYTPTLAAMTFQAGAEFRYRRNGQTVTVEGSGKLGSSVAGAWSISLPSTLPARMVSGVGVRVIGQWYGQRVGVSDWTDAVTTNGTQMTLPINGTGSGVSFNTPTTWQIGDLFSVTALYETSATPL